MRHLLCILTLILLTFPAQAQDQEELLRLYRGSWGGYAIHSQLFSRYVKINASPDWWAYLCSDKEIGYHLVNFATGVLDMAPGLGWADVKSLDEQMGSKGDAPPVLEALDSWKGNLQVTITLPAGLDNARKKQFMDNFQLVGSVVGWKYDCLPRGKKFFLNVTVAPKATTIGGTVSKDGNTYDLALPVYAGITSGPLQAFFQKGMK